MNDEQQPIGIFDSGVGGLSIAKDIHALMPNENLIYVADQAYAPYGSKSPQQIQQRCQSITQFLIEKNCKAIVVACNTATVNAISFLREQYSLPIIGVEPGIKPAALNSRSGIIGVLATEQTIQSAAFSSLINRFKQHVKVEVQACPKMVELVEANNLLSDEALSIVAEYISPLLEKGADQIALGCTHYVFLEPLISKVINDRAEIVNTASPVAAQVQRRLLEKNLLSNAKHKGNVTLFSSSASEQNINLLNQLWGSEPSHYLHVESFTR
ncbi:glutamate racemase [Psychrosphaera aestuarii]|uniref:glutamate racemase n=1 Tax=Psychrosphaera aestuarii TaxID=1266052 RepID=UPI001B33E2E2|nr:glutamate racemase [Psychrosphaera aestuarii]